MQSLNRSQSTKFVQRLLFGSRFFECLITQRLRRNHLARLALQGYYRDLE
jgi:hypothetical protein